MSDTNVGDLIRYRRQTLGMSRRELSLRAGLSESYVSKIEAKGLRPSLEAFARIATSLRLSDKEIAWAVRLEGQKGGSQ